MFVNRLSWRIVAPVCAALMLCAPTALQAQTRQFSFAYDQPKSSGYGAGAELFNKKLMELSKGTLSINQYPGAQLGTEAQTLQKVQTGDIDFVLLSTANASTAQPESGVFSIHFIFRDEAHAIKVLADPKVIPAMKELYASKMKGAHLLVEFDGDSHPGGIVGGAVYPLPCRELLKDFPFILCALRGLMRQLILYVLFDPHRPPSLMDRSPHSAMEHLPA